MNSWRRTIVTLLVATILAISRTNSETQGIDNNEWKDKEKETIDYRLPTTIKPRSYNVMLELPRESNFTDFRGAVVMECVVDEPTEEIVFHAGTIVVTSVEVVDSTGRRINVYSETHDPITEKYKISLYSLLSPKQSITISVRYDGTLRNDMIGFYRSSYLDQNGDLKWLAATQFQTSHARHAFPCFDEPSFKAIFTIRILRPKELQCLSNMPRVASKEIIGDHVWDTFGNSVLMSTYLVAFVISDFSGLQDNNGNFTVWGRPNAIVQMQYALEVGPQALQYLSVLFNYPYQLEKMDMVAIPDFAAGAMENWGLITYRENRMLYDKKHSSSWSQQKVAAVIFHECVHMWFGNLVTPKWWGYLWLSEGFARYYEYMATAKLQPNWSMERQFVVDELQSVFNADSLDSSKPLTRNVRSPQEIGTSGDTITYAKGASVIRMMELAFGYDIFNNALQEYLRSNKYSSAAPDDLWLALQNEFDDKKPELGLPVKSIMDTWTTKAGYPVLSVNISDGRASLSQERFFIRNPNSSPTNVTWWIPITWTSETNPDFNSTSPKCWLEQQSGQIEVPNANQWFIFNVRQAGFYRVNYDKDSWYRLINTLRSGRFEDIDVINRAAIVDDLLNLARAGLLDYDTALTGLDYIKRETNYLPFKAALPGLEYLRNRFTGQPNYDYLRNHSLSLVKYIYQDLGYDDRENDSRMMILLRRIINNLACKLNHEECIERSLRYFEDWRNSSNPIPKNQREAAYCSAIRHGNSADWDFLWEEYIKTNCASEKIVILEALACTKNTSILEEYLLKSMMKFEDSGIRKQDIKTVFSAVYTSGLDSARYILDFVAKYHSTMAVYDGGYGLVDTVLSGASKYFSTQEMIDEFEKFIGDHSEKFETILESLKSALKLAKYELNWYNENENDIMTWMLKNNKGETNTTTTPAPTDTTEQTPTETSDTTTPIPTDTTEQPPTETSDTTTPIPTDTTEQPPTETSDTTTPIPTDTTEQPPTETSDTTTPIPTDITEEPPTDTSNTTDYRLPTNILPQNYVIKVKPYIEVGKFTFDGSVKITAKIVEDTKKIVLHSDEIVLHSIVISVDGKVFGIESIRRHSKYNFVIINLSETLFVGKIVIIDIEYTGQLNTGMRGFYRSSYIADSGETRWLATTHLEPVGARKMFPCFDEPAMKSTFTLSVSRPLNYTAISNTPLYTSTSDTDGRIWDTFEQTPIMSTYLVALIVSDFKSLKDKANNYATWARPNAVQQCEYALSMMAPLVKFYETKLNHSYQLSKLDMAAIPDFASGAMENWGLLTYREPNMLYNPENSPITSKQRIANIISHEISHQWFGNQVSPRWWKYLWLSEGFARYFQFHGTANIETEWGLNSQFVVEQLHVALKSDALSSTHPMTHDVYSPAEISSIFDNISYTKAASILRMIEKAFGADLFYKSLYHYLEARKYNDSAPEDLFMAFQDQINAAGLNLGTTFETIMESWTTQSGYPVVDVQISGNNASLTQKRFSLDNDEDTSHDDIWWIPITWSTKSNPDFTKTSPEYWMNEKQSTLQLNVTDEWILFNVQQSGFYRVNYDTESWKRIINVLKSNDYISIHEINRASLIDDLLVLGQVGQVDYEIVLSATQYLSQEWNYIPWYAAFNDLVYLTLQVQGKNIFPLYATHIRTILKPIYEKLGFEEKPSDSHYDKLLRREVVSWACVFNLDNCTDLSRKYFAAWRSDISSPVPVNLRNTVYCTAIKYGSIEDWEFLWNRYTSTSVTTEKLVILSALGCTKDVKALEKLLTSAITGNSGIRSQDSLSVFTAVYTSGSIGAEYVLDFLERNRVQLYNHYGDYKNIKSILSGISSVCTTKKLVLKLEKLLKTQDEILEPIASSFEEYLRNAYKQLTWYDKYGPRIFEWLDKTYPSKDYRLPTKIYPISYDIYLTPYLDENNFTFDGETNIEMNVTEDTSSVVLHANKLTIKNIIAYIDSVNALEVSSYTIDPTTHRFTIYLTAFVPAGNKLSLHITYNGIIDDKMVGFYRSSYTDENGKIRWMASTQFQPTYARQAFPCFDEPAFKAKFSINIERPNEYQTLSNMPWLVSVPSRIPNRTWDSYEQSIPMSSYLVAFVISDFESLENDDHNLTVWGRPQAVQYGSYALEIGKKVLSFMENFTGIDYPINKLDLVAIPEFLSGAMENWGLITFREYGLFQHKNVTTATYKQFVNTLVSHEIIHTWFGNMVTCDWWDYVWLHEGFAQYFQWVVGDHTEPKWDLLQKFVVYELQPAMSSDGTPSTHPMNNKVEKPSDIADSFDNVAYGKSASVIRMMHHSFGPEVFESGLRTYLQRHQYKTAIPDNLSSAIQFHVDKKNSLGNLNFSVESLMNSWTNNPGYPVVNATWSSNILTIVQERFYLTPVSKNGDNFDNEFWIPVTMTSKSKSNFTDTRPNFWFGTKNTTLPLTLNNEEWFIMNIQEVGYYRVNYDTNSWNRLIAGLKSKNFDGIHEINRAQIIDDLFNLARIDYVTYDLALGAATYLINEENHLPWKAFFNAVIFLNRRFDGHKIGQDFADHVLGLAQKMYEKLGFVDISEDTHSDELNRGLILSWACKFGHSGCVELSKKYFADWQSDETKWISPNAKVAVYCTAIKNGNEADWTFLWNQYKKTQLSSEKVIILQALGCSRNITTLHNYLNLAISTAPEIRDQDVGIVLQSVPNADSFGVDAMLDFLMNNYEALHEYYEGWAGVANLFLGIAEKISTEAQIEKLEIFANSSSTRAFAEITPSLMTAVANAKRNYEWFQSHKNDIDIWLTRTPEVTESGNDHTTIDPNASVMTTLNISCVIFIVFIGFSVHF